MDSIKFQGNITRCNPSNNRGTRQSAFTCGSLEADCFESKNKKIKPSFLSRVLTSVENFFNNSTEQSAQNPIDNTIETAERITEEPNNCASSNTEVKTASSAADFIESPDYDAKIKKASQGKYSNYLIKILSKENLPEDTIKKLKESNLTEEEFLNAVKTLSKSTLKAALNNPRQYINYTQDNAYKIFIANSIYDGQKFKNKDEEAKEYMLSFFKDNIIELVQALQYVDTDTLNQMMDKRSTSFKVQLLSLNKINKENGELLKELISHTKQGDAAQKIKLCQLVEIFQSNGFDMDILRNLKSKGEIDSTALNEMFRSAILKKTGVESQNTDAKTNFNEEYFHLLFSDIPCMNNGNRAWGDDFENLLREAVKGNFENYILDETNKYGKANSNTQKMFIEKGLNYNKWLHPNIEEKSFDYNGKKMNLSLWKRNPFEDIFLGNKTRCCTAITTGSNSAAMPLFLLNTAFNVIEMTDEKGNVKGMARVYMSDIEGKPSLLIDSIELTDIKELSNEDKKYIAENIFGYAKQFAETITNRETEVYYIENDSKLPLDDQSKKAMLENIFIGDVSTDKIYSNKEAGSKWYDIRSRAHNWLYKA